MQSRFEFERKSIDFREIPVVTNLGKRTRFCSGYQKRVFRDWPSPPKYELTPYQRQLMVASARREATPLRELVSRVAQVADQVGLQEIWLFGSTARGDFSPSSDYDIAFIFERFDDVSEQERLRRSSIVSDAACDDEFLRDLDMGYYGEEEFYEKRLQLFSRIQEEGIVMWRRANEDA